MKKEEVKQLANKKLKEGKSSKQVSTEITNLIEAGKLFKENKRDIRNLERDNNRLETENKNLKQKLFITKLKEHSQEEKIKETIKESIYPDTKELRRILLCLNEKLTVNRIADSSEVESKKVKAALKFLLMYKLIKKTGREYERNR